MTSEQFAYWLQGFFELNGGERPTTAQWAAIGDHLKQVFVKVTPQYHTGGLITQPSIGIRTTDLRSTDLTTTMTC